MSAILGSPDIEKLTIVERLDLIGRLWDSIPDTLESLPIPQWHRDILDHRVRDADKDPAAGIAWEELRTELRDRS